VTEGAPGPAAALPPHFELLRQLGAGSHGSVHAALDHRQQRLVAIKLLALPDSLTGTRERFAAEAAAAQRLAHPDIVALLEAGSAGAAGWLVMELVTAPALSRYARPPRLLPDALLLQAGRRLAEALAHAHARGVLHRDVKPANVLVDWRTGLCKLADFGVARLADAQATRTGMLLGSPAYLAPELLAGAVPDARSDLYALGVTLYELAAGRLPFDAGTAGSMGELLRQVARQQPPSLAALRPDLPAPLVELVEALLAKRPTGRPAGAPEVARALRALEAAAGPAPA
jgi:serine/threonine-protein kinase